MPKVEFITHKGKEILFLDFSYGRPDNIMPFIEEAKKIIAGQPQSSLLTLTDVTEGQFNNKISDVFKKFALHNKPYVKAAAVVGVVGLRKVLYEMVIKFSGRQMSVFDTLEEAKDWLVEQ
jgi:hypothetical protein